MKARALVLALGAVALAGWLAYAELAADERRLPWRDVTHRLRGLEPARQGVRVFRSRSDLERYAQEAGRGRLRVPELDFARNDLALVAAGARSSTAYDLRVLEVTEHARRIVVTARHRAPRLGAELEARVVYPYRLISFPASGKPVELRWEGGR